MNFFFKLIVIGSFVFLAYHYIQYLSKTRGTEGYAKRKAGTYLFLGFIALIGVSNVFADALFEFLKLEKPANFEIISLVAYGIFALAMVFLFKEKPTEPISPAPNKVVNITNNDGGTAFGGDQVNGPKITNEGSGTQNIYLGSEEKFTIGKELTQVQKVNPKNIIGRSEDLENLRKELADNQQIVLMNGMGGIGKTTLAEAYVFQYYEEYDHIAWITNNADNLQDDFIQDQDLLKNLNLENSGLEPQPLFAEILRKLKGFEKSKNLLVVDNAVKEAVLPCLKELPSPPNWHLLMTSRETIPGMYEKNLSFLNQEDARDLFKTHCKRFRDDDFIDEIIAKVENHTLTIEILAKTASRMHFDESQLRNAIAIDAETDVHIKHADKQLAKITSYLTSIFDLSALDEQEVWLLQQFTCLPPDFFELAFLKDLINPAAAVNLIKSLNSLADKGWLLKSGDGDSFKMHRIIGEVVKNKTDLKVVSIETLLDSIYQKIFFDQTKDNPIEKFRWISFAKILIQQFEDHDFNEKINSLSNSLGLRLKDLGDYGGAKELLEKAMHSDEKNFGTDHPTTAVSYSNLALVLQDLGDYGGAKELLEKAMHSAEKNFGTDHPTTAVRYSNLATVLQALGDYGGAYQYSSNSVQIFEAALPEGHPNIKTVKEILASIKADLEKKS